ncbi:MAG: MFS transporter [Eubacteriales bacterium]|nr:MFS transporter [Eubacteriales bacterium]
MRKLKTRGQKMLYALSGLGVNMLNLMMGSYLCSAIIASGFAEKVKPFQTFAGTDLVLIPVWAVFGIIAKIVDGVIDVPMASFADNLRSRFGRRRPAIIIGLVPMIVAYLLFLVVPNPGQATLLNTVYLGVVLCLFYMSYTLTMVTYYATYTEIVDTNEDREFISNVKSVCDILYFILGYVGVRAMLNGMNIRTVALIVLPIVLTMLIPLFMIKEADNRKSSGVNEKSVGLLTSIGCTMKNRNFVLWMIVYSFMTFGVQLFLSGINEYFAGTGMNMILVMVGSFAPVPLALVIYRRIYGRYGFGTAFRYALITFSVGMLSLFGVSFIPAGGARTVLSVSAGILCSLAIGALFSVAYSVPSQLAADEEKKTGIANSAMYFAVQGLFSGVATAIGSYVVLNALKAAAGSISDTSSVNPIYFMTAVSAAGTLLSFVLTYMLPRSLVDMGKKHKKGDGK